MTESVVIDVSRLDAIDHKDALDSLVVDPDTSPCLQAYAVWLIDVFGAAVRLLGLDDHTTDAIPLALSQIEITTLAAAHRLHGRDHAVDALATLHQEYADALQDSAVADSTTRDPPNGICASDTY